MISGIVDNLNTNVYTYVSDLFSGRGESPHRRYPSVTGEPASALHFGELAELVKGQCRRYSPD
ncbi:hypothetical protein Ga0466249_004783 [Sporomusaceae bacterium BoRhaA]|nr:hypothetical protein [Pelorhabdus rhamnosifermentans]